MHYFAYGSNMCAGRLKRRVPSATLVAVAKLRGHSFRFHKRSNDASAKGDALETDDQSDVVWGVIFNINDGEKQALDRAEGLRAGYNEKTAAVFDESERGHPVILYIADPAYIDTTLRPYSWYKRFVVDGAGQHALPNDYVALIAAMPDIEDPDRERDRRKRSIAC
jgi:hypothetical protein